MNILIRIKQAGRRKDVLQPTPYTIPDDVGTLRELLCAICASEVMRYNETKAHPTLFPLLTQTEIDGLASDGRVSFGEIYSDKTADLSHAVQNVLQSFEDGLIRVLADDCELTELDAPLSDLSSKTVTFIRLTFLSGRMW